MRALRRLGLDRAAGALACYLGFTVALTWPLVRGLSRDVPSDFGDPLLNSWIVAWNADRFLRLLSGDVAGFAQIWHANIFQPEPYVLAYSELLHAQGLQALPIWALTRNPILCYNLLFLSTFVLSALGMYLLVRELTGDWRAGFVAGLIYGFLPYRIDQLPHFQTLSSQWMPFALYGLRRYFVTSRWVPLAGAALALVAQNLSCGYFLVFFSIFVPPYVIWEMATRGLLRDWRTWRDVGLAAIAVGAVTVPAMYPYVALRQSGGFTRSRTELGFYSADLLGYLTAPEALAVWGWLRAFPKAEGAIFLGFTGVLLAAMAAIAVGGRALRAAWTARTRGEEDGRHGPFQRARRFAAASALVVATGALGAAFVVFLAGPTRFEIFSQRVRMVSLKRPLIILAVSLVLLLVLSRRARGFVSGALRSPAVFFGVATLLAAYLALGPTVHINGVSRGSGVIYGLLYDWLPGFDGLRVPARYAMVSGCFLAVTAGFGAAWLFGRWPRAARGLFPALALAAFADGYVQPPFPVNRPMHALHSLENPPRVVRPAGAAPAVYHELARLPDSALVIELPLGDLSWDIQATFYSTVHWRRLLNGYSGYIPDSYRRRAGYFVRPLRDPDATWRALEESGATHLVLHREAFPPGTAAGIADWALAHGARRIWSDGTDELFVLP